MPVSPHEDTRRSSGMWWPGCWEDVGAAKASCLHISGPPSHQPRHPGECQPGACTSDKNGAKMKPPGDAGWVGQYTPTSNPCLWRTDSLSCRSSEGSACPLCLFHENPTLPDGAQWRCPSLGTEKGNLKLKNQVLSKFASPPIKETAVHRNLQNVFSPP